MKPEEIYLLGFVLIAIFVLAAWIVGFISAGLRVLIAKWAEEKLEKEKECKS